MSNKFLATKTLLLNIDMISSIWFDDEDEEESTVNILGENIDLQFGESDPDYEVVKKWVENCASGIVKRNEKRIFICSHCGAPNTEDNDG